MPLKLEAYVSAGPPDLLGRGQKAACLHHFEPGHRFEEVVIAVDQRPVVVGPPRSAFLENARISGVTRRAEIIGRAPRIRAVVGNQAFQDIRRRPEVARAVGGLRRETGQVFLRSTSPISDPVSISRSSAARFPRRVTAESVSGR